MIHLTEKDWRRLEPGMTACVWQRAFVNHAFQSRACVWRHTCRCGDAQHRAYVCGNAQHVFLFARFWPPQGILPSPPFRIVVPLRLKVPLSTMHMRQRTCLCGDAHAVGGSAHGWGYAHQIDTLCSCVAGYGGHCYILRSPPLGRIRLPLRVKVHC